jgi:hypothetical protein
MRQSLMKITCCTWWKSNKLPMKSWNSGNKIKTRSSASCLTLINGVSSADSRSFFDYLITLLLLIFPIIIEPFLHLIILQLFVISPNIKSKLMGTYEEWYFVNWEKLKRNIKIKGFYWFLISKASRYNEVGIPLEPVIPWCAVWTMRFVNYLFCYVHKFLIGRSLMESFLHCVFVEFLETFHSWAVSHHYYTFHYFLFVLSDVF